MSVHARFPLALFLLMIATADSRVALAQLQEIPAPLKPWEGWVTWGDADRNSPATFNNADERISFWPSRLSFRADPTTGKWNIEVAVFAPAWVPLPGNADAWPLNVQGDGEPIAVIEREGAPMVHLEPGRHQLSGEFQWDEMPQKILIPKQIGLLSLSIGDQLVSIPNRDEQGFTWLKRIRNEEAEKDLLAAQVYRVIEDGIPTWLRTDIELTVSGKSREEELGWTLPDRWILATIDSPIPVAIDDQGRLKAQVRPGKWTISLHAFRNDNPQQINYAEGAQPIIDMELIGFKAKPDFRLAEIEGIPKVDASQTTFPNKWRDLPMYQWDTSQPFQLVEKIRGMGLQRPEGLQVARQLWLDEDGRGLTYRDTVTAQMQQLWRLDAADDQELGAVRIDGKGQLITANPLTNARGVEVRERSLNLEAVGRVDETRNLSATGWQSDVDALNVTLMLPPGWRAFALFGPDSVQGDWLTAWSLLDLFLLLIFSLAVSRIFGWWAGIIAFIAFGLAYHEPGSPRYTWLFLLFPVALLQVVPEGLAERWVSRWKYVAVGLLVINLVPFIARQVQITLYPQLESAGVGYRERGSIWTLRSRSYFTDEMAAGSSVETEGLQLGGEGRKSRFASDNLLYDPKAQIQTGPAVPEWSWNRVNCQWDGPVTSSERIRPILISLRQHRILTMVRIVFLLFLAAILVGMRKMPWPFGRRAAGRVASAGVIIFTVMIADACLAQEFPSPELLRNLRERLLKPNDAFPRAAEISTVSLSIEGNSVSMIAEINTALEVAVPLPGRLPVWSPVSVTVDDKPAELVRRKDGYLWIVLPSGVHRVAVDSILPDVSEWDWTFVLPPRRVEINASGWAVTGVRPNGIPERQVFFTREQQTTAGEAAYDRKDFNVIVAVDRNIETGLVWQVRNEVTRLAAPGRAVSLRLPLLAGESVLSSNVVVQDGQIEVRLGAGQDKFSWSSELPIGAEIQLAAPVTSQWVERWHLLTSPVWNVTLSGLAPIFEPQDENLIPVWNPWPGESATLSFSKPEAISGATITVKRVKQESTLSGRQRSTHLQLDVECSLGGDFVVALAESAEISSLEVDGQSIPPRRSVTELIVPVHPGQQNVDVHWLTDAVLTTVVTTDRVTLPVDAANVTTIFRVPDSRWVLWTDGPLRGPAVRFWTILIVAVLTAIILGSVTMSPLRRLEWGLLAIGLTQVHIAAALFVVGWLFLLALRGRSESEGVRYWVFNLRQIGIVFVTVISLMILVAVVGMGLLGHPDMFILGNQSSRTFLQWFQPRAGRELPMAKVISISVWYYRLLMLFWALWLAASLLRWLQWGWMQFSKDGLWKPKPRIVTAEFVKAASVPKSS